MNNQPEKDLNLNKLSAEQEDDGMFDRSLDIPDSDIPYDIHGSDLPEQKLIRAVAAGDRNEIRKVISNLSEDSEVRKWWETTAENIQPGKGFSLFFSSILLASEIHEDDRSLSTQKTIFFTNIKETIKSFASLVLPPLPQEPILGFGFASSASSAASFTGEDDGEKGQSNRTTLGDGQLIVNAKREKRFLEFTVSASKEAKQWDNKLAVISVQRDEQSEAKMFLIPMTLDEILDQYEGCIRIDDPLIEKTEISQEPLNVLPDDVDTLRQSIEVADELTLRGWRKMLELGSVEMSDDMRNALKDILSDL